MSIKLQTNYLELVRKFKKGGSRFQKEVEEECLLMFLEFILREQGTIASDGDFRGDHICEDNKCYCGDYVKGDVMKSCDGGCMYPGA